MAPSESSRSMMSITSDRLTIARTAYQPSSSSLLIVGDSKPGVTFSASASFDLRHVVFEQRVAAGDHHAFEPTDDAIAKLACFVAGFWTSTVSYLPISSRMRS